MRSRLAGKKRRERKVFAIGVLLITLGFAFLFTHWVQTYNPGKFSINGPFGLGTYEFDRSTLSEKELDIAWKLYVQLKTRKATIPIDEQDDIISEVYDSWYQLFTSTREYLIEMPAQDLEGNVNAQRIVDLSLDVLNSGLRPHLTKWQGKYRKWYDEQLADPANKGKTPQEIQKQYPYYGELMADMKNVNAELTLYAEELKRFSHETPPSLSTRIVGHLREIWDKIQ